MFITFEGSEGSGKTSHIPAIHKAIMEAGHDVLVTREPGGTQIGDQIRTILMNFENTSMVRNTETLLFLAARAQLVEQVIRPHLLTGGIVVSDRYSDSTLAYQGYGRGVDLEQLKVLLEFATCRLKPDLTLLFDVDVEVGLRRRASTHEWNRLDALDVAFYQRVRQGYLSMAAREPERWVVIDANQPQDQVFKAAFKVIIERLSVWR